MTSGSSCSSRSRDQWISHDVYYLGTDLCTSCPPGYSSQV